MYVITNSGKIEAGAFPVLQKSHVDILTLVSCGLNADEIEPIGTLHNLNKLRICIKYKLIQNIIKWMNRDVNLCVGWINLKG